MTLVILAAGLGNRYGGLKQIDPVGPGGEFIIDYSIYDAVKTGCDKVVFIILEKNYALFRETVGKRTEDKAEVAYAFQDMKNIPADIKINRDKPWGTVHALLSCKNHVNGDFIVINADDFYGRHTYEIIARYLKTKKSDCMPGYILKNTMSDNGYVSRGICSWNSDGYLTDIAERKKIIRDGAKIRYPLNGGEWAELESGSKVSMNFWGFRPEIFSLLEREFAAFLTDEGTDLLTGELCISDAVGSLVKNNGLKIKVLENPVEWFGFTYPADKPSVMAKINALVEAGVYPQRLLV